MGFILRPGLSFCEAAGHFIFLDLAEECYFALAAQSQRAFRRLLGREHLDRDDHSALAELIGSEVIAPSPADCVPQACIPPPEPDRSLLAQDLACGTGALGQALWSLSLASLALKLYPLGQILTRLKIRVAAAAAEPGPRGPALLETAAAFKRAGLLLPSLDRCLPRSIALAQRLAVQSCPPSLVIAVRAQPFRAHCWVQCGRTLVNETLEEARNFTPILVV